MVPTLPDSQRRFVERAITRKRVFLPMMTLGILAGVALLGHAIWLRWTEPTTPIVLRVVLGILVLLNARQQLRQHRYTEALSTLLADEAGAQAPSDGSSSVNPASMV